MILTTSRIFANEQFTTMNAWRHCSELLVGEDTRCSQDHRQRAVHYNERLAALSLQPPMPPPMPTYAGTYTSSHPAFDHPQATTHPHVSPSTSSSHTNRRDPTRERSRHPFYAVRNGVEGDEIYTSWRQAAPNCWDATTQTFYEDCTCKGFTSFDAAADWLLSLQDTSLPSDLPPEPPMAQSSHSTSSMASIIPDEDPPNVTTRNVSDQPSINTKDYEKFISDKWLADVIPTHVSLHSKDTSSDTDSTTLPFLSSTSSKALPTYSGKSSEDINEFLYKLKIFLNHPSIDNCHKDPNTNTLNFQKSKNLSTLLGLCISGDALSPFIDNPFFEDKGIEMVHHLISMKHPASQASASAVYNNMYSMKMNKSETFEAFAKRLRIHYRTCTRSGFPYEEGYLVRCFINGLDGNFDHVRTLLQNGALHWYTLTLNEVIKEATEVKLNR